MEWCFSVLMVSKLACVRRRKGPLRSIFLPTFRETLSIILTFGLTVLAWIFFRAESLSHAFSYLSDMLSSSLFTIPKLEDPRGAFITIVLITLFMIVEWIGRAEQYGFAFIKYLPSRLIRYCIYYIVIAVILFFGNFNENEFIYFQF